VQSTGDDQVQVRYSMVRRSGGRMMPCAIYIMHKETRNTSFLIDPQNQGRRVSRFGPQNRQLRFLGLGLKTEPVMGCQLHHKTDKGMTARDTCRDLTACFSCKQVVLGFSSLPQNWRKSDDMCWMWHH
jgi:hypothetical protein